MENYNRLNSFTQIFLTFSLRWRMRRIVPSVDIAVTSLQATLFNIRYSFIILTYMLRQTSLKSDYHYM